MGIAGPVGKKEKRDGAENNGGQALQHEQPAPAFGVQPVLLHDPAGKRGTDYKGERDGGHEVAGGLGPVFAHEPVADVNDDAGKEAGLCRAQQKARAIELAGGVHGRGQHGEGAPDNHDGGDPAAGAPALHQQRAGNLQAEVAYKENAGADAENLVGEMQVANHFQRGIGQVGAVQVIGNVENEQEGKQAASNAVAGAVSDFGCGRSSLRG